MKNDSITFPRYFILVLVLILLVPLLTACSTVTAISNGADFAVSRYCKIPSAGRAAVRKAVGRAVYPNKIEITCVED